MIDLRIVRSNCHNVEIKKVGKYNYICSLCGRPQMLYLVLLSEALENEKNYDKPIDKTRRHSELAKKH